MKILVSNDDITIVQDSQTSTDAVWIDWGEKGNDTDSCSKSDPEAVWISDASTYVLTKEETIEFLKAAFVVLQEMRNES